MTPSYTQRHCVISHRIMLGLHQTHCVIIYDFAKTVNNARSLFSCGKSKDILNTADISIKLRQEND